MVDLKKPVLLFDFSYYIFYRYYAVRGWYNKAFEKDLVVEDTIADEDFISKYDSTFEKTMLEFAKKYKVPLSNIIFARDCPREQIWRIAIYPEYKATRDDKASSFNGDIFKHTYNVLFPKLQKQYGIHYLYQDHLEADDIVAVVVDYIRNTLKSKTDITIVTNDNDYVQLYKYNVRIINLQKKHLYERIENVDTYLQIKIIIGKSNNNEQHSCNFKSVLMETIHLT